MPSLLVTSPDGTSIAAEHVGIVGAPSVVLVHGIAQSRHTFRSVLDGPLAAELHLAAFDLRGHGESAAPVDDAAYASGERLGGDLHAVIEACGLVRPIVVAWSYGGVVVGEYLRQYGQNGLSAILFAAAAVKTGKAARGLLGPVMLEHGRALMSDDPAVYESGGRAFLEGCTAQPLAAPVFAENLQAMLRVPAHARRALLSRSVDFATELAACTLPVTTLQGTDDRVILPAMSDAIDAACPNAQRTALAGVGHIAWLEAPGALEDAIRALVRRAPH